ncbi:MAG: M48 family metallopeptidase [Scytolyngbya sp. HA4215-MV1]|nr:M48 family metallopeptidase [Scytolyngbya sp. HA4215-MV1]
MLTLKPREINPRPLPDYTVRESPKAKHIRLKVSIEHGVEVIVPKGFDQDRIPDILQKKQTWLGAASDRIEEQRKFLEPKPFGNLPEYVALRAVGEDWKVEYQATASSKVATAEKPGNRLIVRGNIEDEFACKLALHRWIARKAHSYLVPWLKEVGEINNLPFCKTLVKGQRTRWASCSRHKTISINHKLLFLPQHLVRYVFIHELSHTIHMSHSKKFWALVCLREPDYQKLDDELRDAWRYVPAWMEKTKRDSGD